MSEESTPTQPLLRIVAKWVAVALGVLAVLYVLWFAFVLGAIYS